MAFLVAMLFYLPIVWSLNKDFDQAMDNEVFMMTDGDIMLNERQFFTVQGHLQSQENQEVIEDVYIPTIHSSKRKRRAVTAFPERIWLNKTIPFVIGYNISDALEQEILKAMGHWEKHTCLRFVKRTTQDDYIIFKPGPCGCCSYVGRKGGIQHVTLSPHCGSFGVVIHELGHVIGFWHEHSRPDRDKYINILTENVFPGKLENFEKKSILEIDSIGQPYDYYSVMHYRTTTFSRNRKNTMEPLRMDVDIGQREALSPGDIVQARLLYNCPKPKCYEEFTRPEANFSTPNYPVKYFREHNCTWIIHVFPEIANKNSKFRNRFLNYLFNDTNIGQEVALQFIDFSLETSVNCSFDFVEIRQGIDDTGQLIGRLCGNRKPGVITSSQSLWVHFHSDKSVAFKGFLAHFVKTEVEELGSGVESGRADGSGEIPLTHHPAVYKAACNVYLDKRKGVIEPPLIPVFYTGQTIECTWTIDGGQLASRVFLKVVPLELVEVSEKCMGDIYQHVPHHVRHHSPGGRVIKKWSKTGGHRQQQILYDLERYIEVRYSCEKHRELLLGTRAVMIQWSSHIHPDFTLSYLIDYNECELHQAQCNHYCQNTLEGYNCTCKDGHKMLPNGWRCVPKITEFADKCGSNLTGIRGKIRASTEPVTDCYFYLSQPPDMRMLVTFHKFQILSNVTNGTCDSNYLEILTGKGLGTKGIYCGVNPPPPETTPSGSMAIRVHTELDTVHVMPYFTARYIAYRSDDKDKCSFRVKASGNVTSPSFPDNYPPHSMCIWRVSAKKGMVTTLIFQVLDIEWSKLCNFDFLEIRNGRQRTSPLLGRYCGRTLPESIVSTGRHLWIMFLADDDISGKGFQITFKTQSDSAKREKNKTRKNSTE